MAPLWKGAAAIHPSRSALEAFARIFTFFCALPGLILQKPAQGWWHPTSSIEGMLFCKWHCLGKEVQLCSFLATPLIEWEAGQSVCSFSPSNVFDKYCTSEEGGWQSAARKLSLSDRPLPSSCPVFLPFRRTACCICGLLSLKNVYLDLIHIYLDLIHRVLCKTTSKLLW